MQCLNNLIATFRERKIEICARIFKIQQANFFLLHFPHEFFITILYAQDDWISRKIYTSYKSLLSNKLFPLSQPSTCCISCWLFQCFANYGNLTSHKYLIKNLLYLIICSTEGLSKIHIWKKCMNTWEKFNLKSVRLA
jgi:hypothetical protein